VQEQKRCGPSVKISDPTTGYSLSFCRGKLWLLPGQRLLEN